MNAVPLCVCYNDTLSPENMKHIPSKRLLLVELGGAFWYSVRLSYIDSFYPHPCCNILMLRLIWHQSLYPWQTLVLDFILVNMLLLTSNVLVFESMLWSYPMPSLVPVESLLLTKICSVLVNCIAWTTATLCYWFLIYYRII